MTRFLTLAAVAAVAGAMYVAAAPGGLRSAGPTRAQFKALKLRVAKLEKSAAKTKKVAAVEGLVLVDCLMYQAQAVDDVGDSSSGTYGYSYTDPNQNGGQPFLTTALALAPTSETTSQFYFLGVNPLCASTINSMSSPPPTAATSSALRPLLRLAGAHGTP
jgi:hypothetical protein